MIEVQTHVAALIVVLMKHELWDELEALREWALEYEIFNEVEWDERFSTEDDRA